MHRYVFWFWHSVALCGMNYGTYRRKRELVFDSYWKTAERKINRPFARTWYGINYAGTQVTQWDFQNKGKSDWTGTSSFVLEIPL